MRLRNVELASQLKTRYGTLTGLECCARNGYKMEFHINCGSIMTLGENVRHEKASIIVPDINICNLSAQLFAAVLFVLLTMIGVLILLTVENIS